MLVTGLCRCSAVKLGCFGATIRREDRIEMLDDLSVVGDQRERRGFPCLVPRCGWALSFSQNCLGDRIVRFSI